jgi:hypothetical protein
MHAYLYLMEIITNRARNTIFGNHALPVTANGSFSDIQKYSQILELLCCHMTSVYQGLARFSGHIKLKNWAGRPWVRLGQISIGNHAMASTIRD